MKNFILFTLLLIGSLSSYAYTLEDGTYTGKNIATDRNCSVKVSFDGDYITVRGSSYRITVLRPGPFIQCENFDGIKFENCGSGALERGNSYLQLYGVSDNFIKEIEINNGNNDSTDDKICIDMKRM